MKNRLLSIVKPIPSTALHADRLETFRANLYSASDETRLPLDEITSPPTLHACNWCGTWMPIPMQANIAIIDTMAATAAETLENTCADKGPIMLYPEFVPAPQLFHIELVDVHEHGTVEKGPAFTQPHMAKARHYFCPTLCIQYPEHVPAAKLHTFEIFPAIIDEAIYRPTLDDFLQLLQPTLCSQVSRLRYSQQDLPLERQLRMQRVAALRARWANRSFTGLGWIDK